MSDQLKRHISESTDCSNDTVMTSLSQQSEDSDLIGNKQQERPNTLHRYQHNGNSCTCARTNVRRQFYVQVIVLIVVAGFVSAVVSLFVAWLVTSGKTLDNDSDEKSKQQLITDKLGLQKSRDLCFDCAQLDVYVGQWAWKGVKRNRKSDKCCFKDKFSVLQTLKFYTDVKMSQLESHLSRARDDLSKLETSFYNQNNNGTKGNNSSMPNVLPSDLRKWFAELLQRKRTALRLRSDELFNDDLETTIQWSDDSRTSPIQQGNVELHLRNERIRLTDGGIFRVRVEIQFDFSNQPNSTRSVDLTCHVKGYGENGGLPWTIEDSTEVVKIGGAKIQFYKVIDTLAHLKKGEAIGVTCLNVGKKSYLSTTGGVHRITLTEEA